MTEIKEPGPILSEADIGAFEAEFNFTLPIEYKNFLLSSNGGKPASNLFDYYNGSLGKGTSVARRFFSIDKDSGRNLSNLIKNFRLSPEFMMPSRFLPFAGDPAGNYICISVSGADAGKIYFWEHDMPGDWRISYVADNFDEFFQSLYADEISLQVKPNLWTLLRRLLGQH